MRVFRYEIPSFVLIQVQIASTATDNNGGN